MSTNPFTGEYTSPFAAANGLPRYDGPRRWEDPPGTMVSRALGRGIDIMQQNLGSAVEGIGNVTGIRALADYGADVVRRNQAQIDASRAMESDGPLSYFVSLLGENAPQLALSVGAPLVGGLMRAAQGFRVGAAASAGFNYAMLAGEARETQRAENERQGLGAPINEAAAFGAAVPAAALDTLSGVMQARLATRFARATAEGRPFFSAATARDVAGAAARGAATEAPTEAGQQAILRAQAGQSLTDREAALEILEAGMAGAILGGTLSGGARTLGALRRPAQQVTNEDIVQTVDAELGSAEQPDPRQPGLLQPGEAGPGRTLQNVPTPVLVEQLMAAQQRELSGQASREDVTARQMLQAELRQREREAAESEQAQPVVDQQQYALPSQQGDLFPGVAPPPAPPALAQPPRPAQRSLFGVQEMGPQRPFGTLSDRELEARFLEARKQEAAAERPQEVRETTRLRQMLQAEMRRRDAERAEVEARQAEGTEDQRRFARPSQQGDLFDGETLLAQRAERDGMAAIRQEMSSIAQAMGLSPRSKFAQRLSVTSPEELLNAVLDGLERTNAPDFDPKTEGDLSRVLQRISYALGVGRDFDAEIGALEAQRDQLRRETGLRTQESASQFRAMTQEMNALMARKDMYERVVAERRAAAEAAAQAQAREQALAARRAQARAAVEARMRDRQRGRDMAAALAQERAREQAEAQARAQAEAERNPLMAARLQEAQARRAQAEAQARLSRQRQQEFEAAQQQRRDADVRRARQQAADQLLARQNAEMLEQLREDVRAKRAELRAAAQRNPIMADRLREAMAAAEQRLRQEQERQAQEAQAKAQAEAQARLSRQRQQEFEVAEQQRRDADVRAARQQAVEQRLAQQNAEMLAQLRENVRAKRAELREAEQRNPIMADRLREAMAAAEQRLQQEQERQAQAEAQARLSRQRQQELAAAEQQRRDADVLAAERQAREQIGEQVLASREPWMERGSPEALARLQQGAVERRQAQAAQKPAVIVSEARKGNTFEMTTADGVTYRLDKRRDGFYLNNQRVGRTIETAREGVRRYHDAERGIMRRANKVFDAEFESVADVSPAGSPLPGRADMIRNYIAQATRGWAAAPGNVVVVDSYADLPAGLADADTAGVIDTNGDVYIVADAHQHPMLAVGTLFHEVLGHRGLRLLYGRARADVLENLYENSQRVRDLVQEWEASYSPDVFQRSYGDLPLHLRVEEALATMSEGGPIRATLLDRMKKVIADFARRLGLKVQFSEAQIRAIMAQAHELAMAQGSVERDLSTPAMGRPARRAVGPVATPSQIAELAKQYKDPVLAAPILRLASVAASGVPDTPQGDQTIVQRLIKAVTGVTNRAQSTNVREAARAAGVYYQSLGHLVNTYGDLFKITTRDGRQTNALKEFQRGRDLRASVREIIGRVANQAMDSFAKLSPTAQQDTLDLMTGTFLQLDPGKRLEDHAHLTPAERAARRSEHAKLVEARNRLARDGNLSAYDNMVHTMRATYLQQHTMDLYDLIRATPEIRQRIQAAGSNPILKFAEAHRIQGSPQKIEQFWDKELKELLVQTKAFVAQQTTTKATDPQMLKFSSMVGAIREEVDSIEHEVRAMNDYPYFHLGRFGKYYASFQLRSVPGPNNTRLPDPRAVRVVQERLKAIGMDNVVLSENADGSSVFIRVESPAAADTIQKMAQDLMAEGVVDDKVPPKAGEVDPLAELPESARKTLDSLLLEVEARNAPTTADTPETSAVKAEYVARLKADLKAAFLARLPDSSVAKVMARRGFKAGFDKDMLRAFALRMQVASNSAASRLAANITGDAINEMTTAVSNARAGDSSKWTMTTVLRELMKREATAPDTMATNFIDAMRAFNHNYFLAWNPGYWLTQITQLQTNLWPELVKSGMSYKDAFGAMQRGFGPAFQITKAVIADAKKRGFARYGADATVTTEVLDKIQLLPDPAKDAELKQFILRMYLRGSIDIGSASRELGRVAEGRAEGKFDTTMRWASSSSYYLETMTRLTAALAAREVALKQGKTADQAVEYATDVVREAMLDYTESNRARAFGKQGLAAQFTPLATAFLSFQFLMLEKYSREIGTAFISSAATPQERAAARRWLASHMASMTVLAGSLGLPFVTVIARAIDALKELLSDDEEPFDSRIAYRNFLADIFGQDVAEVLARGLPRAVGFDISGRIGAADILPFSQLIADRRDWDDALNDMAARTYGSAFSILQGMLKGGQRIADGDILGGMREALPVAVRNPLEAVRYTQEGIVDRRGNLLPIEPSAMMVVWQALGLTPAERAEYSEANFAASARRGVLGRSATRIRQTVARAVQTGDQEALRAALERVREFDANVSPAFRIGPNLATSVQQAVRRREMAQAMGAPLGLAPQDLMGQNALRFANF